MPRYSPGPNAIDPISGFKVKLSELVRQWDGEMVAARFADRRNPQDFVRGVPERSSLPYSRPETADVFIGGEYLTDGGEILTDFGFMLTDG